MAYNGYNGFHDDVMDGVETSGPKVTVREVRRTIRSLLPLINLTANRSNKTDAISSYNPALLPSQIPFVVPCSLKSPPSPSILLTSP